MKRAWDVDDHTEVEAYANAFTGRIRVRLNGREVFSKLNFRFRRKIPFVLADGRPAEVTYRLEGIAPWFELRVGGALMVPRGQSKGPCPACGGLTRANDVACVACGAALPTGEEIERRGRVKEATHVIWAVAVLFALSGAFLFFVERSDANDMLTNIATLDAADVYPEPIDGDTVTVAELRDRIAWEPWVTLTVHLVLAAAMTGLALWSRRSPLPAILGATGLYALLIVGDAIGDPSNLGKGVIMKFLVILFLAKGIRAALDLRTARV